MGRRRAFQVGKTERKCRQLMLLFSGDSDVSNYDEDDTFIFPHFLSKMSVSLLLWYFQNSLLRFRRQEFIILVLKMKKSRSQGD